MVELPDELPPIEPLPEPGVLVVPDVLPDVPLPEVLEPVLPLMPDEEPDEVPPDAPVELDEPDLLKWASHSWREIWPSLLVSTDEKLGDESLLDEPLAAGLLLLDEPPAEPVDDEPPLAALRDESLEPLPDIEGEEADGVDEDGLLDDEEEDCATANVESANRTAAVVMLRALGMDSISGE